jgi:hemerythrin
MEDSVTWKKEYEIGIPEIDSEHQVFVSIIQKINEAYSINGNRNYMTRLITELYKYADFHFISEENIMFYHHYSDYINHKKEHKALLYRLSEIIGVFETKLIDRQELISFLLDWFKEHTTKTDKKLAVFLKANE